MDDQPSDSLVRPELTIDQIIALEPRFAAWLEEHAISADMHAQFWREGWAAQFYAEAIIAGTAADLGPFLVAIDDVVFSQKAGHGMRFVEQLIHTLFAANCLDRYVGDELPPTLLLTWEEWHAWDFYESRHDTWSYGKGYSNAPSMSGY
jgi:hypothetical protein